MAKKPFPTSEVLRQLLRYEPETGKLFWKERPASMFKATAIHTAETRCRQWNGRYAGKEAITALCNGYLYGGIGKRSVHAHRVAWVIYYGELPKHFIDHINGLRTDNRICNLREATPLESVWNTASRRGSSQYKGVSRRSKDTKWTAEIRVSGVSRYLGRYDTEQEAALAYDAAARAAHGIYVRLNFPDQEVV